MKKILEPNLIGFEGKVLHGKLNRGLWPGQKEMMPCATRPVLLLPVPGRASRYCICTSPTQLANGGSVIEVVVTPCNEESSVISVLTAVC
jgi:hypothetical protein